MSQLEERYLIIKRKHLTAEQEQAIREYLLAEDIPLQDGLVLEPDWPQYEPVKASLLLPKAIHPANRFFFKEAKKGMGSMPMPVSPEAVEEAQKQEYHRHMIQELSFQADKKTLELMAPCKEHPVCHDTEGYIYHTRYCLVCGHTSLL